jgi:hypothetical protein
MKLEDDASPERARRNCARVQRRTMERINEVENGGDVAAAQLPRSMYCTVYMVGRGAMPEPFSLGGCVDASTPYVRAPQAII